MKHSITKLISLFLALLLLCAFTACTPDGSSNAESTNPSQSAEKTETRVMILNGTTGFGMAKLMQNAKNGKAALRYSFSVESSAETILKALINGSVDIAALPTNAAAKVYQKTNGAVQMLAINTLGVLYVVANGETEAITNFESLRGKTVYCPADNPAVLFTALCEANGLKVGTDITIDTTYAAPAALRAAVAAGEVSLAVLPEPMVTIAMKANDKLVAAMDLTKEWDKVYAPGSLAQGCIVVRTAFASEHPEEIKSFLEEYGDSIRYMQENVSDAAEIIVAEGVFSGAAPVVAAAIPRCNVTFVTGSAMRDALKVFYETLYAVDPASIGGALPGDDFYYTLP